MRLGDLVLTQDGDVIFIIKELYCVGGGGNDGDKRAREVPC
jgi:ketosteroid isomerase-like protein